MQIHDKYALFLKLGFAVHPNRTILICCKKSNKNSYNKYSFFVFILKIYNNYDMIMPIFFPNNHIRLAVTSYSFSVSPSLESNLDNCLKHFIFLSVSISWHDALLNCLYTELISKLNRILLLLQLLWRHIKWSLPSECACELLLDDEHLTTVSLVDACLTGLLFAERLPPCLLKNVSIPTGFWG